MIGQQQQQQKASERAHNLLLVCVCSECDSLARVEFIERRLTQAEQYRWRLHTQSLLLCCPFVGHQPLVALCSSSTFAQKERETSGKVCSLVGQKAAKVELGRRLISV